VNGEEKDMMVRVMYTDNSYDLVKVTQLDGLIISGRVAKFLRAEGWVTIGLDPIRTNSRAYAGQDRRTEPFQRDTASSSSVGVLHR
jgi:hypothetical protein